MVKVSVCIPNYNGAQYIGEAIQSVLNQSYKDFELIISDNCSTDNSIDVVNKFIDHRIKIYRNSSNIGMVSNWNKCISLASGDYICLLSHDDILEKDILRKEVEILDSNPNVGFVFTSAKIINSRGEVLGQIIPVFSTQSILIMKGEAFFREFIVGNKVSLCTIMFRKECFNTLGNFDENTSYACDWEMCLRISLYYDVAFISEQLAYYRTHSTNTSNEEGVDIFLWPMAKYNTLKKVFSMLPPNKKELLKIKPKAMRLLAKNIVRSSTFYLAAKKPKSARQVIAIAFAIDESIILYPITYGLFFLSYLGATLAANIVFFLRKLKKYI